MSPLGGRIKADISVTSILGHCVLWIVLGIVTFGIALMFYPYSFAKLAINRCYIQTSDNKISRLHCTLNVFDQIGHILLWLLLTVITFGLAYPFYLYKVWNFALNNTSLEQA
ncbi:MAG TPA: DUF6693 family protein [Herpetosiphonaceae bacterium]